jgi:predicted nicotinamide N-methyase
MKPRTREAIARLYRRTARPVRPGADDLVEVKPGVTVPRFVFNWARAAEGEASMHLERMPAPVALEGQSVLTIGRGGADVGVEAARRGARRVVAVEMAGPRLEMTAVRLEDEGETLPVELKRFEGSLAGLGDERFDVILAFEAFRRYGAPRASRHMEELVGEMANRLDGGGKLAVTFSPPWKAPFGGGKGSRLPWAHLLFPEDVVIAEYNRLRGTGDARSFDDLGFNRITVARFRRAMQASGLERLAFRTNVGDNPAVAVVRVLSRIPGVGEYVTQNLYGVWRRG